MCFSSMSVGGFVLLGGFYDAETTTQNGEYRQFSDRQIHIIFGAFSAISVLSNLLFLMLPKKKPRNSLSEEIGWSTDKRSFWDTLSRLY